MNPLLIILAIIPGLGICYLIYRIDKYEKEKILPLLICFLLGVIVTFPAIYVEQLLDEMGLKESPNLWLTLLLAFVGVALLEELLKFICLIGYPFTRHFFNEPLDGISYAVMIGMGFATFENILYAAQFGFNTTLIRAFTAVPAHAVFAIFSGYYVGKAKFVKGKARFKLIVLGLGAAVAIHGLYDFFILQQLIEWLIIFSTVILLLSIVFARRLILEHQRASPFNENNKIRITPKEEISSNRIPIDENDIMDAVIADLEVETKKKNITEEE